MDRKLIDMSVVKQEFDRLRALVPNGVYASIDVGISSYTNDPKGYLFEYSVYVINFGATTAEDLSTAVNEMIMRIERSRLVSN